MVHRKQNMLEAFRESSIQDALEEEAREKAESEALSGTSSASGVEQPSGRASRTRRELRGPLGLATRGEGDGPRLITIPAQMLGPIVLLQLLLLALAFWFGRSTGSDGVRAAENDGQFGPELPVAKGFDAAAAQFAGQAIAEEAEAAFRDPANRYSVRVVQFPANDYGKTLAFNSYDYLLEQRVPAIRPMQKGKAIVVCVGAGQVPTEMNKLRDRVRELPGPDPKDPYPYQSAYCVNIDELIRR